MEFKQAKLDNGLQVIAEINEASRSVAIGYFVGTGSRNETPDVFGGSHFLEHMIFKGTETRSAEDVNRSLDDMGGCSNAFTMEEMTVYYAAVLPELQGDIVALLSDLMRPALRQTDFDTEKQVIIEEINMYNDRPPYGADDLARSKFFKGHPLSQDILGSIESIEAMTASNMRLYFEKAYSPDNIVVAACGKVDFDRLVDDLARRTASWTNVPFEKNLWRPKGESGFLVVEKESSTQEYMFQLTSGPSIADPDRYAAVLLDNVIGDDVGSRLYWALLDNGKADSASFAYSEYTDTGIIARTLASLPECLEENLKIMTDICMEVQENGVTEEELQRAKNKTLSRIILGSEQPRSRLFSVGAEWLQTGKYSPIQNDLRIVQELTTEDLHNVLRRYPIDHPLTAFVGPMSEEELQFSNC